MVEGYVIVKLKMICCSWDYDVDFFWVKWIIRECWESDLVDLFGQVKRVLFGKLGSNIVVVLIFSVSDSVFFGKC